MSKNLEHFDEEQKLTEFREGCERCILAVGLSSLYLVQRKEAALGTLITQIKQLSQSPTRKELVS